MTIQSVGELDEYEEENIARGLVWLEDYSHDDYLTASFWLKLHKKLFSKVWKWAGKVRTHELDNPDFLQPHQIWEGFKKLENDLTYWFQHSSFPELEIAASKKKRVYPCSQSSKNNL